MHPLAQWFEARKANKAEFARRVGISRSHLTLIIQGKRGVSVDVAKRIAEETGGDFSPSDFGGVQRKADAA